MTNGYKLLQLKVVYLGCYLKDGAKEPGITKFYLGTLALSKHAPHAT